MTQFHLVQVNVARLLAPEGDPKVAVFFDNIDRINAIAESSEGFVWRYTGDYEPDPMIVYNASIWESLEHLSRFVYRSDHLSIFRQRESWFAPMDKPSMALWWAEKNTAPPNFKETDERLNHLYKHGSTEFAFTFKQPFPAPTS